MRGDPAWHSSSPQDILCRCPVRAHYAAVKPPWLVGAGGWDGTQVTVNDEASLVMVPFMDLLNHRPQPLAWAISPLAWEPPAAPSPGSCPPLVSSPCPPPRRGSLSGPLHARDPSSSRPLLARGPGSPAVSEWL